MKKISTVILSVILFICSCLSFTSCLNKYCDPRGKAWYNYTSLPDISNPFAATYDGSYSVQIDKKGNIEFKTLNGDVLTGTLSCSFDRDRYLADIDIQFDNGETAGGYCEQTSKGRNLKLIYKHTSYEFGDKRQTSKEEFEEYRRQFVGFLTNVYETGVFPTEEEIKVNSDYRQFTDYHQIDPCCNGPIDYEQLEKAVIEKVEIAEYNERIAIIMVNVGGESFSCEVIISSLEIALITRDGEIKELGIDEVKEGGCLLTKYGYGEDLYSLSRIFYIEGNA